MKANKNLRQQCIDRIHRFDEKIWETCGVTWQLFPGAVEGTHIGLVFATKKRKPLITIGGFDLDENLEPCDRVWLFSDIGAAPLVIDRVRNRKLTIGETDAKS